MNKKELTLADTAKMMVSEDYKDRFKAEYEQLLVRTTKLNAMVTDYSLDLLDFTPATSLEVLRAQVSAMKTYLALLRHRAGLEGIALEAGDSE